MSEKIEERLEKNKLAKVGVQFGTLTRFKCSSMKENIFSYKNKRCILDLDKVAHSCLLARDIIFSWLKEEKKNILFLSNSSKSGDVIKEQAKRCGMPFMVNKWPGGFLTNFNEMRRNIKVMQSLTFFSQKESFKFLLKKEQKNTIRNLQKLQKIYEGVNNLWKMPDALFILGLKKNEIAFEEAKKMGVPVLALCNSNANPSETDCSLIGNDENPRSLEFFSNLVADIIISFSDSFVEQN